MPLPGTTMLVQELPCLMGCEGVDILQWGGVVITRGVVIIIIEGCGL